jgi:hypothetical protein
MLNVLVSYAGASCVVDAQHNRLFLPRSPRQRERLQRYKRFVRPGTLTQLMEVILAAWGDTSWRAGGHAFRLA